LLAAEWWKAVIHSEGVRGRPAVALFTWLHCRCRNGAWGAQMLGPVVAALRVADCRIMGYRLLIGRQIKDWYLDENLLWSFIHSILGLNRRPVPGVSARNL
jgi:hypothetical protein